MLLAGFRKWVSKTHYGSGLRLKEDIVAVVPFNDLDSHEGKHIDDRKASDLGLENIRLLFMHSGPSLAGAAQRAEIDNEDGHWAIHLLNRREQRRECWRSDPIPALRRGVSAAG